MKIQFKRLMSFVLALVMVLSMVPAIAFNAHAATPLTTSVTGLGASWDYDSTNKNGTVTPDGNAITIKATGGMFNRTKIVLTLTNNLGEEATLRYSYRQDGGTVSGANTETVLANGASTTITFESGRSQTNYLYITDISLISNTAADPTITFKPGTNGSYTVDGTAITADTEMTVAAGTELALVATPASGYQFMGWQKADGSYVSQNASYTLIAAEDVTITPVFISSSVALFGVGATKYDDLTEAGAAAAAGTNKTIILLNNGTVSGSHTIPKGTTLLIPYDDANTAYGANASCTSYSSYLNDSGHIAWVSPTAYRTLTLAGDANITVNGNIEVGGRHAAAGGKLGMYGGSPTGKLGYINMLSGSHIDLNSGANLYCWGYIYGDGTITAKSGASIYENFQIMDFRGGSVTMQLASEYLAFPLSQYYVQNVEVATRYEYGATEYVATSIFMSNQCHSAAVKFIGEGAMFQPASGSYFVKDYNPATDMLEMHAYGSSTMASMNLELGGTAINSAHFVLPITNNIAIHLHSGTTTLKQNMMMLPGSSLTIDQGATLNLAYTNATGDVVTAGGYVLQVFDSENWTTGLNMDTLATETGLKFVHPSLQFRPVAYTCTTHKTRTNASLTDVTIDINGTVVTDGFMYSTVTWKDAPNEDFTIVSGGANVISSGKTGVVAMNNGAGQDQSGYMYDQAKAAYYFIPLASVQLKNGDGTLVDTTGAAEGDAYYYCATHDCWYTGECSLCNVAEYTITFYDDEGNELDSFTVEEGATPAYSGQISKDYSADDCHEYEFKGWASSQGGAVVTIPAATADADYYAVFELVTNENHNTTEFRYNANGNGTHQKVLACCGEVVNAAETCTDGTDKDHNCDNCDATNVDDGHFGGTATCVALAVCDECGQSYGAYGDHEYNQTAYTNITATHHTVSHICKYDATHIENDEPVEHTYVDGVCACKATKIYTVTWNLNGGESSMTLPTSVAYGKTVRYQKGDLEEMLTKEHYSFAGLTSSDVEIANGSEISFVMPDHDVTINVNWEALKYRITWDIDGKTESVFVAYGETPVYDGTPTKAATAEYTYTFSGWYPAVTSVTGDATYTAQFTAKANYYGFTFDFNGGINSDNDTSNPLSFAYNETNLASDMAYWGECSREGYTLVGWNTATDGSGEPFDMTKSFTMPAHDVTIYAQWELNEYTITWNVEGVQTTTTVKHGETPVFEGTPAKEANAQYTYTFSGWTPEVVSATGEAAYTAQFTPVLRSYDITFVVDGVETKVPTNYGETPVIADPTKATDVYYTYTFAGWTPEVVAVTGEATYTATWTETPVEYTVTFVIDGETFHLVKGTYGKAVDTSNLPSTDKTGYTFNGWDTEIPATFPAENIVITGSYTVNQYTITFMGEYGWNRDNNPETGEEFQFQIKADYNADLTEKLEELRNALPDLTGFELENWFVDVDTEADYPYENAKVYTVPETMPAEDVVVYARWQYIYYDLTILSSIDNNVIATSEVNVDEAYDDIEHFHECHYIDIEKLTPAGYIFEGYTYKDAAWDPTNPNGWTPEDQTLVAQFVPKDYTITFMNGDEVHAEVTAAYGSAITLPENPTKEGYVFAGWVDVEGKAVDLSTMPLDGMDVFATFAKDSFKLNFFATEGDASAVATFEIPFGTDLLTETPDNPETEEDESAPSYLAGLLAQVGAPTKEGHTFQNWNVSGVPATMPAEAVNVYGNWTVNEYLLYFENPLNMDANFNVYLKYQEKYDNIEDFLEVNFNVEKELNVEGYTFTGFKYADGTDVTFPYIQPAQEVTIIAQYKINTYTITFDVEGIDPITAEYGAEITWPEAPTKTGHMFWGWDKDNDGEYDLMSLETMPAENLNLKAVWVKNICWIYWNVEGQELGQQYKYGDTITPYGEPTKAADDKWTYKLVGWKNTSDEIVEFPATVTENMTYYAVFEQDEAVKYTVKFVDGENTVYETKIAWNGEVTLEGFEAPTKDHYTLSWTVDGAEVSFPYAMDTKEVTFVANWIPNTYSIYFYASQNAYNNGEVLHKIDAAFNTEVAGYSYTAPEGWNFDGWKTNGNLDFFFPYMMGGEDVHLIAQTSRQIFTATFVNGDWSRTYHVGYDNPVSLSVNGTLDTPKDHDGYAFKGWFDENDVAYTDEYVMPAHNVTFTAKWAYTGWFTDDIGTTYLFDDEKAYFSAWAMIGDGEYWFDANSYIVKDITLIDGKYYAFDHESGKFMGDYTGIYTANNGDIYYVENGIAVANKGLTKIVDDNGHIHYYYFGCSETDKDSHADNSCNAYLAQKSTVHWVENNNGYLVQWDYTFDENGVIVHDEDTSKNGVHLDNGVKYYYIDGVKVHFGLFIGKDGEYYYARSNGSLVVGRDYWISESHLNGVMRDGALVEEGSYTFDEEGRIVWPVIVKSGIYAEDGSLYYYADGVRTYAGLIKFSGDLVAEDGTVQKNVYADDILYVRTSGELAVNRSYWATKNNGIMASASYNFDEYGRMIRLNGLIEEDGGQYYYVNGNRYHAGLIKIDDSFYYIKSSGQAVAGCRYWITHTNGYEVSDGITEGSYEFAADGKMIIPEPVAIKNGIVEENGKLVYYVDGKLNYAGLIQYTGSLTTEDGTVIEGAYENAWIYVRTSGELVVGRSYWPTKNNGYMKSATYQFDENGIMLNPPV